MGDKSFNHMLEVHICLGHGREGSIMSTLEIRQALVQAKEHHRLLLISIRQEPFQQDPCAQEGANCATSLQCF